MTTRIEQATIRRRKQNITTILYLVGRLLLVIAVGFLLSDKKTAQAIGPARVGKQLGDFSLTDINGKKVHLSDYTGQVVLLNASATCCPPCMAEMPDLNAYFQAHQAGGFTKPRANRVVCE
jgi:cytochrome oxidase Cu insertion factor (SCO1/SenC/PrrC family)